MQILGVEGGRWTFSEGWTVCVCVCVCVCEHPCSFCMCLCCPIKITILFNVLCVPILFQNSISHFVQIIFCFCFFVLID